MNILIVGGNGFIGKYLTESLLAFDQSVSIIDIADRPKNFSLKRNASYYQINALSKECREVFSIGQFDVVYFVIGSSHEENWLDSGKEISPLLNILNLSREFKIKKFIYISTSYLYTYEAMNQEMIYKTYPDFFLHCSNKKSCEMYCNLYKDVYALNMLIIRIPPIYGPGQNKFGEGSIIINIFDSFQKQTSQEVSSVFKDIELTYISDVIRTLTTTALASNFVGNYKIKGDLLDLSYIIRKVRGVFSNGDVNLSFKFDTKMKYPLVENAINRLEDNTPFSDGFTKTYEWYKSKSLKRKTFADNNKIISVWKKYKPWIESVVFSFLIVLFGKYTNSNYDLAVAFIMIIGLIYGINVALFAGALSMILYYLPFYKPVQLDLYSMERFFAYLSVALISGYKKSVEIKSKRIQADTHIELEKLFSTVQTDLIHTRRSASLLTEQLKTYEYSYSTVYNAIKRLNDNKNHLTQVLPDIISELTGFGDVKLETRNNLSKNESSHENDIIKTSFEKNEVYFNTELLSTIKIIIPLFNKKTNKVDSLIAIRNIPFEKMNVNVESQMHFIYNLVTDYYNKE